MHPCLEDHIGPQNQTLEIGNGWKGKLILQASYFGVPCFQSCTILKLESHVKSCPSSPFRRFEPFTAQDTPRGSFATVFSVISPVFSSNSLWEKERVRYDACLVPGLTKLTGWWQFNFQRASKDDHAKTLATGFTVQALCHPLSGWNLKSIFTI